MQNSQWAEVQEAVGPPAEQPEQLGKLELCLAVCKHYSRMLTQAESIKR